MTLSLHVLVQQRLPHETSTTHQTLVRFLVRMDKSVCVAVITAVESLATDFAHERFLSSMDAAMFLEMFGIDESSLANGAFEGTFSGMSCFYVVVQQPT